MSDSPVPESPWLSGAIAPVYAERTEVDLEVVGVIPGELSGRFVKIGPNPIRPPARRQYRPFFADGMVHGVRLHEGRAEWYRNRWVRSRLASRALGEPSVPGARHALWDKVNTHVIGHGGMTLALVEAGCTPAELSYELDTVRYVDFERTLPGGFSAHPKRDPITGELHLVAYRPGRRHVQYIVVGADARVRKVLPVRVPATPIMHDMALTENHVILFDLPARLATPAGLVRGSVFRWNPRYPARFGVLHRSDDREIRWYETDPCFILHTVNAYEVGASIVIDGMRYEHFGYDDVATSKSPMAQLWRWTIDLESATVRSEQLDDQAEEFPRIDDRRTSLPYRYAYTAALREIPGSTPIVYGLIKRDVLTGTTELRRFPNGVVASEPVFVPRIDGRTEDDGWVMTYVTDLTRGSSDFVIYDARAMTADPVAVTRLPVRVPTAFHGSWIPDTEVSPTWTGAVST